MTWTLAAAVSWGLLAVGWHYLGLRLRWYKAQGGYWWFDETAHFNSGGALFLLLTHAPLVPFLPIPTHWAIPWGLFVACVGAWEVWEYHHGDPEDLWHSTRNMVHDLMSGGLAALLVWTLVT